MLGDDGGGRDALSPPFPLTSGSLSPNPLPSYDGPMGVGPKTCPFSKAHEIGFLVSQLPVRLAKACVRI